MSSIQFFSRIPRFSILVLMGLGLIFMAGGAFYALAKPNAAVQAGFAPHKALYNIELKEVKSGAQIVNISGKMFYAWQSSCDAWLSDHRFNLAYEYADSPSMRITSDFSIYEPFDGRSMDFVSRRKRDGTLFEELRGHAQFDENNAGAAVYSMPPELSFDLPKGTQFPMAHSLSLLKALQEGEKFYRATVFDGSDSDGPVEVNAFIGKPANALANIEASPDIDMALVNVPARRVRLAFFPLKEESQTSDYEMDVVFHENGVISDMFIEYDDFSVRQKLVALEKIDETPCHGDEGKK